MELKNGKVICITSCKGGVGKTITTLNLAGAYHLMNKKVLIIDLDLFGGAIGLSLDVKNDKSIYDLIEDLKVNNYNSFDDYIAPYNENIDVLSCPNDPRKAFKFDPNYINNIITSAKAKYDVILIDTTHGLNEINLWIMDISDTNLFLITNDPYDLKNVRNMITILKEVNKRNYKILLNESRDTGKDYFTNFDIKKIINNNIDYTINKTFYVQNIDKYLLNNEILILNKSIQQKYKTNYDKIMALAKNLISEGEVK